MHVNNFFTIEVCLDMHMNSKFENENNLQDLSVNLASL